MLPYSKLMCAGALHAALLEVHMLTCTGTLDATAIICYKLRCLNSCAVASKFDATVLEIHVHGKLDTTVREVHVRWHTNLMLHYLKFLCSGTAT